MWVICDNKSRTTTKMINLLQKRISHGNIKSRQGKSLIKDEQHLMDQSSTLTHPYISSTHGEVSDVSITSSIGNSDICVSEQVTAFSINDEIVTIVSPCIQGWAASFHPNIYSLHVCLILQPPTTNKQQQKLQTFKVKHKNRKKAGSLNTDFRMFHAKNVKLKMLRDLYWHPPLGQEVFGHVERNTFIKPDTIPIMTRLMRILDFALEHLTYQITIVTKLFMNIFIICSNSTITLLPKIPIIQIKFINNPHFKTTLVDTVNLFENCSLGKKSFTYD